MIQIKQLPWKKIKIIIAGLLFFLAVFNLGFFLGANWGWKANLPSPFANLINKSKPADLPEGDMSIFWDTWKVILEKYVGRHNLETNLMIEGATKGLVESLADPYSEFLNLKETTDLTEELAGQFEGIGAEIERKEGFLIIVTPLKNSPAEKAGLQPEDRILKIDDKETFNLTLTEAVKLIRGPKGTIVTLTIYRPIWGETKEIKIIREKIDIPSLKWQMLPEKFVYLRIYNFNEPILFNFYREAVEIITAKPKGIILDLRNNPGGYLNTAIAICGWFFPKGEIILKEDFGEGEIKIYRSYGNALLTNIPIVVLINKGTASASEILAGALRDNRKVKLIGETSFGKGSVQELVSLKKGGSIKITIAKWLTPKGTIIKEGLKPDIEIKMEKIPGTYADISLAEDTQLQKAIEILKEEISFH